ncbi:uncharacterized protein LOC104585195 [Brachypodium distachyon]|uniref:uncharacterized protein LOC104585195 n=1 Tax=Brachypodium distachyon TaxID=15368 RepID=UPI000D0D94CD|nr:uncharacterized protein LOC104585195 [Brachypodium distachyon]|eukprot:XP_024313065.1 uncharacterized protein LOC104585195 [Brachypodium distachyon]
MVHTHVSHQENNIPFSLMSSALSAFRRLISNPCNGRLNRHVLPTLVHPLSYCFHNNALTCSMMHCMQINSKGTKKQMEEKVDLAKKRDRTQKQLSCDENHGTFGSILTRSCLVEQPMTISC